MVGLHQEIIYSFLLAGHTKFSPDRCFGLAKQQLSKTYTSSLFDIARAVQASTVSGVNIAQLCGLHDGTVLVPSYDWATRLSTYFRKLPGVTKYQHFRFHQNSPGKVFVRLSAESPETEFDLLRNKGQRPTNQLPGKITPAGLDAERKAYLHKEIRPFCRPGTENFVAPKP